MFRLALTLLSSLQVGTRLKETVERTIRQAAIIAVAVAVLIAAIVFGLVAAYYALISVYGFAPAAAAGIMALILVILAVLILLVSRMSEDQPKSQVRRTMEAPAEGLAIVDKSLGKAMQQVSPLTLIAIAFAAGLLASRRR